MHVSTTRLERKALPLGRRWVRFSDSEYFVGGILIEDPRSTTADRAHGLPFGRAKRGGLAGFRVSESEGQGGSQKLSGRMTGVW